MKTNNRDLTSETTRSVRKSKTDRVAKTVVRQGASPKNGITGSAKAGSVKGIKSPVRRSKLSSGPVNINGRIYDESDFERMAAEVAADPTTEQVARLLARQASGDNRRGRPALQGGSVPARTRIGKDLDRRLEERAALDGVKKATAMRAAIERGLSV